MNTFFRSGTRTSRHARRHPDPSENPFLFGHDTVSSALATDYRTGRLHHALLLRRSGRHRQGDAGVSLRQSSPEPGKRRRRAVELADPDPTSSTFRQIASDAHPSVLHLTRPVNEKTKGFKTAITADEVRRINRFLSHTSHDGSWRVVIVDPADDMNRNAANALLKNLEEPPTRTLFILIAHQPGRLLPTIRSRCRLVKMTPLAIGISKSDPGRPARSRRDVRREPGPGRRECAGSPARPCLWRSGDSRRDAKPARHPTPRHRETARVRRSGFQQEPGLRFDLFLSRLLDRIASEAALAGQKGGRRMQNAWHPFFRP